MEAIHSADDGERIEVGDNVLHPDYGLGEVVKQGNEGSVYVDFMTVKTEVTYVDVGSLDVMPTLLDEVDVSERPERPVVGRDGEPTLHVGEVIIDLDFADGVGMDVDVIEEDNRLIVQYWREEQ